MVVLGEADVLEQKISLKLRAHVDILGEVLQVCPVLAAG